jgi:hypothetical protein
VRSKSETKSITGKARENVEVHMKYFLHGSLPVSQEEIDALASYSAIADSSGHSLRLSHQSSRRSRVEVGKIRCMTHRDHENVSGIDGLNIHESGALLITEKERGRRIAG